MRRFGLGGPAEGPPELPGEGGQGRLAPLFILASDEVQRVKNGQETAKDGALGNLYAKSGATYAYGSSKPHAVTQVDGTTYGYDGNGNMTARGSETLTFNAENRLSQWTSGASTATFVYDGDGFRVKKTEGGQTTLYANRSYEKNATTGEETLYYWLGGRLVAVKRGGTLGYVHQDHLGSSSLATDTAGNVVSSLSYLPFGGTRASSGLLPTERKFTGQRLDNPVNIYFYQGSELSPASMALRGAPLTVFEFYNGRPYDPAMGRFLNPDALVPDAANPQALNRYAYVANGPLSYVDPDGHCPWCMSAGATLVLGSNPLGWALAGAVVFGYVVWSPDPFTKSLREKATEAVETAGQVLFAKNKPPQGALEPPKTPKKPDERPGPDWEWRGKAGSQPGDRNGNWYNPKTGEVLRPDLEHPSPSGPHWDWRDSNGKWWRIYPDGRIEPK